MERNVNKDLEVLYKVLKSFSIRDLETVVKTEFPEISLKEICKQIESFDNVITSSSIAMRLIEALEEFNVTPTEIQDKIAILKIRKVAINKKVEWHAYEMREQISAVGVDSIVPRIGRSLKIAMRQQHLRPVVHAHKMNDFIWISVSSVKMSLKKTINRKQNVIFFAVQPGSPFIFLAPKMPDPSTLEAFAQGLGYQTFRDRKLKGRDLQSLLRITDRKKNLPNPNAVVNAPTFKLCPVITGRGIDFTATNSKEDYLDSVLGKEPPVINVLEIEGRCPLPDELGGFLTTTIELKSDNVAAFVKEMVLNNVMRPNSVIVKLLQSNKNKFVLDD